MPIRIKGFRVKHNGIVYMPGEDVPGLSDDEVDRLVSLGAVERVGEATEQEKTPQGGTQDQKQKKNAPGVYGKKGKANVKNEEEEEVKIEFDPDKYMGNGGTPKEK